MKIIKQGTLPEKPVDETFQECCSICHTVFEYALSEVILKTDSTRFVPDGLIACPLCNQLINLDDRIEIKKEYYDARLAIYQKVHTSREQQ